MIIDYVSWSKPVDSVDGPCGPRPLCKGFLYSFTRKCPRDYTAIDTVHLYFFFLLHFLWLIDNGVIGCQ
jgi:hypothetical protein